MLFHFLEVNQTAKKIYQPSRKSRKNTARPVVIIVCDGTRTEPIYFKNFENRERPLHVKVVPGGKNYLELIKKGISVKGNLESECSVWCVTDVDADPSTPGNITARNTQLKEFAEKAKENGFRIALSNPCFELWFLLHFTYTHGSMLNYDAVKQRLIKHIPDYKKNDDYFDLLVNMQESAISNAKALAQHHTMQGVNDFINVSVNPYTGVHELIESIRS